MNTTMNTTINTTMNTMDNESYAALHKVMTWMAEKPPLQCHFYYQDRVITASLKMPLVFDGMTFNEGVGTKLEDLEIWLCMKMQLTSTDTVYALVPADEIYAPPLPLAMLNNVAVRLYEQFERTNEWLILHYLLVVKPIAFISMPLSTIQSVKLKDLISSDLETRQMACIQFTQYMHQFGYARVIVPDEMALLATSAYSSTRAFLKRQQELHKSKRWLEFIDQVNDGEVSVATLNEAYEEDRPKGRFVGVAKDAKRTWVQMRRPLRKSIWPPPALKNDLTSFSNELLILFNALESMARACVSAIEQTLLPSTSLLSVLDDLPSNVSLHGSFDDSTALASSSSQQQRYGASVLRIYEYYDGSSTNEKETSTKSPSSSSSSSSSSSTPFRFLNDACGLHADLGLLTVAPPATTPGLLLWHLDQMRWIDLDSSAAGNEFTVFAGETMGRLSSGVISAPLHRVPHVPNQKRMSMPFFLRARPDAILPYANDDEMTCESFMKECLFRHRPWRRERSNGATLDY